MIGKNIKILSFLLVLSALLYKMANIASADEIKFPVLTTAVQQPVQQPTQVVVQQPVQQQYVLVPASSVNSVASQPQQQINQQPTQLVVQQPVQQQPQQYVQYQQQPVIYQQAQPQPQQEYIHTQVENQKNNSIDNTNKVKKGFSFKMNIFTNMNLVAKFSGLYDFNLRDTDMLAFEGQPYDSGFGYNIQIGGGLDLLYRFDNNNAFFLGIEGTFNARKDTTISTKQYNKPMDMTVKINDYDEYKFSIYGAMNEEIREIFDISGRLGLALKIFGSEILPYVSFGVAYADYRAKGILGTAYKHNQGSVFDGVECNGKGVYEVKPTNVYGAKIGLGADLLIMKRLLLGIRYSASLYNNEKYINEMFNYYELPHNPGTVGEDFYNKMSETTTIHNIGLRIGVQLF